jgi:two-component system phosphate regulon sensor histidine kinase PhoR
MGRPRFLWQLYGPAAIVIIVAVVAITLLSNRTLHEFSENRSIADLEAQAYLVDRLLSRAGPNADLQAELVALSERAGTRITLIAKDGKVLGDSHESPEIMESHESRPEILRARKEGIGWATRHSRTLGERMVYVAIRATGAGDVAVVRAALPEIALANALSDFHRRMAFGAVLIVALAGLVTLVAARRISRPLEDIRNAAGRFASGDLSFRIPTTGSEETAELAQAMNDMAAQLDDRIHTVLNQRNEQEAVLSSMVEGVLAVDSKERVLTMNHAAGNLLSIAPPEALGRTLQEITRNSEIHDFARRALRADGPTERDITFFHSGDTRSIQAHGAPIQDADGRRLGVVIVLNDVTRLRRLESIRQDFVANVSHELKTPITSIKGFVETLRDGAMNDAEDASRFLAIIARQADRLGAIIEDLLSLSRIEQDANEDALELQLTPLRGILAGAMESCRMKAGEKSIEIDLECSEDMNVKANAPLLEQALVNLIDNAIKYSPDGAHVRVSAEQDKGATAISVADDGCGIAEGHVGRLFERFYRVDKARSRQLGGTGLGLAIVKHIALAHGGRVSVESRPNEGSTFTLHLEANRAHSSTPVPTSPS